MVKPVKPISAEVCNRNKSKWHFMLGKLERARAYAGQRQIYRLPNGTYAIRKPRRKK